MLWLLPATKNNSLTQKFYILKAGFGNGNMCGKSIESMARQPEESGKIFTNMLVCVGLIESMPILCYVIAIVLVFANPFIK